MDGFDYSKGGTTVSAVDELGRTLETQNRNPERKAGVYCLKIVRIVATHIGLLLLLVVYLLAGAYMFRALELDNEYSECVQRQNGYLGKLNSTIFRVIGMVESAEDRERQQTLVNTVLSDFALQLYVLDHNPSKDCETIKTTTYGSVWNIPNGFYFCVTILTTIGFGHITPSTSWGQLTCIPYACVGIPLMLIYLAVIGKLLARAFRVAYINIICCRCFHDIVRRKRRERRERLRKWEQDLREHEEEEARRRGLPVPPKKAQAFVVDEDDEDDMEQDMTTEKVAVPLTVSVFVLSGYTLLGAVLFRQWEDWSLITSAYCSFITISTIGFGDYVPGSGQWDKPEVLVELLVGAFYLLFGLSLLSMCLNLMQVEILAKIAYIGKCFGLGEKETEKESDELVDETDKSGEAEEDGDYSMDVGEPAAFDNYAYQTE